MTLVPLTTAHRRQSSPSTSPTSMILQTSSPLNTVFSEKDSACSGQYESFEESRNHLCRKKPSYFGENEEREREREKKKERETERERERERERGERRERREGREREREERGREERERRERERGERGERERERERERENSLFESVAGKRFVQLLSLTGLFLSYTQGSRKFCQ